MMLNFRNFMEALESFVYKVPKDKSRQLFDFYAISKLPKTGDVGIDWAIEESREKLYPVLQKNLLKAVYFAIVSEMRHSIAVMQDKDRVKMRGRVGGLLDLFKKYENTLGGKTMTYEPETRQSDHQARLRSFAAANELGEPRSKIVRMAEWLFDNLDWGEGYGGTAWAAICRGWLNLAKAKDLDNMMVWIDHVYDLQHNSNVVLDKVNTYYISGQIEWLRNALDLKSRIKSLYEIWKHISPSLQRLVSYATKSSHPAYQKREKGSPDIATKERWQEIGEREYGSGQKEHIRATPQEMEKIKDAFREDPVETAVDLLEKYGISKDGVRGIMWAQGVNIQDLERNRNKVYPAMMNRIRKTVWENYGKIQNVVNKAELETRGKVGRVGGPTQAKREKAKVQAIADALKVSYPYARPIFSLYNRIQNEYSAPWGMNPTEIQHEDSYGYKRFYIPGKYDTFVKGKAAQIVMDNTTVKRIKDSTDSEETDDLWTRKLSLSFNHHYSPEILKKVIRYIREKL
jgi:hypothetical protein